MIAQALKSLHPTCEFILNGTLYEGLEWLSADIQKPSKYAVLTEAARLQAEYDAKKYQRDRAEAYPSIQEQLDMQYWDAINGTTVWQETINAIKAKYPKVG
jgi:hypothetical protein